jgi:large subunit ribosomal protein L28
MLRAALTRLGAGCHLAAAARPPTTTRAFASNRSKRGIYAGKDIRFGNNISFSHRKTRRTFKPNAQRKRLWSETLGCWLRFNLTTHALRCIDRAGGIDAYLLKTPDAKLGSIAGANARRMIESARASRDPS